MANKTSQHILGTSSNLLGFCLIVITSLHISQKDDNTLIDEITCAIAIILTLSSILSFASIRTGNEQKERKLELLAEIFFFIALAGNVAIIIFIAVCFWNKS